MGLGREYYEGQIRLLKKEMELEQREENQRKTAEEVRGVYQSYLDAGFTEEQAWEIFMTILKKA